jgi:hypothetical protein
MTSWDADMVRQMLPIQVPMRDTAMGKALRAQFPKRRHHYDQIVCAWCKRGIGWKLKNVAVPGDTTYGICPPCEADSSFAPGVVMSIEHRQS